MLGEDKILTLAEQALRATEADQAEVVIWSKQSALTRFAESVIHQNMARANAKVILRAVVGKQVGCAVTNRLDLEG
ncbi:MAG: hypothetical protein GTO55_06285, partial [Armatimonadetes bacterium]|nr:hypothetical protein [Armatimonadota bacterium]NIM23860.1 hypothetical protein [Armatimonadota bacterium]NIM67739.1 hypothetical protein [Armatimonadota bacterium]NIM76248.1 hypothetical protein [Armatimonadota bacterium]NIN05941.1 hypothetical protein [Armatimonadota bacterium]